MVDNSGVVVSLKVALNSTRVNLSSLKKRKDALESTGSAEKKDGFSEEFEYLQQQVRVHDMQEIWRYLQTNSFNSSHCCLYLFSN